MSVYCPRCDRDDAIRKVSAVYESGTFDVESSGSGGGVAVSGGNVIPVAGSYYGTEVAQSRLAQRLAPPEEQVPGCAIGILLVFGFLGALLLYSELDVLARHGGTFDARRDLTITAIVLLALSLLAAVRIWYVVKYVNPEKRREYQQWMQRYYCFRCDYVFEQSEYGPIDPAFPPTAPSKPPTYPAAPASSSPNPSTQDIHPSTGRSPLSSTSASSMSVEVERALRKGFPDHMRRRDAGQCASCGKAVDPESFRDDQSRKEFKISGLCQSCQDRLWPPINDYRGLLESLREERKRDYDDEDDDPWRPEPGSYVLRYEPELGLIIYGEVHDEKGGIYGRSPQRRLTGIFYSADCPDGEYGTVHLSDVIAVLTREQFGRARVLGWPADPEVFAQVVKDDARWKL